VDVSRVVLIFSALVATSLRSCGPRILHSFPTRRSSDLRDLAGDRGAGRLAGTGDRDGDRGDAQALGERGEVAAGGGRIGDLDAEDRKSTRLNSSHVKISYAVFCLKKKICITGERDAMKR